MAQFAQCHKIWSDIWSQNDIIVLSHALGLGYASIRTNGGRCWTRMLYFKTSLDLPDLSPTAIKVLCKNLKSYPLQLQFCSGVELTVGAYRSEEKGVVVTLQAGGERDWQQESVKY